MGANSLRSWRSLPAKGPLWLTPPRFSSWQKKLFVELKRRVPQDSDTVWVFSSGTQSVNQLKCIGLKREAILASAEGANRFLNSNSRDVWLIAIPTYHVGGFSILARAHLSGAKIVRLATWNVDEFVSLCSREEVSLCSLVPTQVHDLVQAGRRSPPSLRAIIVGGGALDEPLYLRARALGWPVLPSYGLTETASQIATASLDSLASTAAYPALQLLPHARVELREGRVWIRAESLCHWIATANTEGVFTLENPLREGGWLPTEDLADWQGGSLRLLGRRDDVVKVLGVLVPIQQVESDCREFLAGNGLSRIRLAVITRPHARLGHELVLFYEAEENLFAIARALDAYNSQALGPYRLSRSCWLPQLPRTALGKVKKGELRPMLSI